MSRFASHLTFIGAMAALAMAPTGFAGAADVLDAACQMRAAILGARRAHPWKSPVASLRLCKYTSNMFGRDVEWWLVAALSLPDLAGAVALRDAWVRRQLASLGACEGLPRGSALQVKGHAATP